MRARERTGEWNGEKKIVQTITQLRGEKIEEKKWRKPGGLEKEITTWIIVARILINCSFWSQRTMESGIFNSELKIRHEMTLAGN